MDSVPSQFRQVVGFGPGERFIGAWFVGRPGMVRPIMSHYSSNPTMGTIRGVLVLSDTRVRHFNGEDTVIGFAPPRTDELAAVDIPLETVSQVSIQKATLEFQPVLVLTLTDGQKQVFYPPRKEILQELYDQIFAAAQARAPTTGEEGALDASGGSPLPSANDNGQSFIHYHAEDEP